ncbi:RluA family pseudouridine synthase [Ruminococcus sp. OA3]|uniref:RluA family pseudouridine synthase n=1 Tax=Ruminococcus sp. OA3 TaxID=2914164 RepID=UPI001F06D792|nr:RluA family pseudouridine synthase [Ruminococcus sp. OA3]MCH1982109.1 RluA family pseudouridine synthase [Ruminococcus sp. OA3]
MAQFRMRDLEENIVYEDREMIVINKLAGVAVQSARFGQMDLESAVKNYLSEKNSGGPNEIPYLGIIHRLDQPVEGLVIFGKTKKAAKDLSRQITDGTLEKYYLTVVENDNVSKEGILEHYLVKDGRENRSRAADQPEKNAKRGILHYRLIEQRNLRALVEIRLLTGRHHQIRVQMSYAGMPLAGDQKYNARAGSEPLALCAYKLQCTHPATGKRMSFQIPREDLDRYYKE